MTKEKYFKVCHLTTVHPSHDVRIYMKECRSLAAYGHDVTLIAQHKKAEVLDGVNIRPLPLTRNAFYRLLVLHPLALWRTLTGGYKVVHVHDPELILIAFINHLFGKVVIYDMHEDFIKQLEQKQIPKILKFLIRVTWPRLEAMIFKRIGIVFAEDSYVQSYPFVSKSVTVLNMPLLNQLSLVSVCNSSSDFVVGYVGGISRDRGASEMIAAVQRLVNLGVQIRLELIGPISEPDLAMEIEQAQLALPAINYYGELPPEEAWKIVGTCHVGLALLKPRPNYIESYPTKLFEYMAMGIPVITSNFPLYSSIVEAHNVGYCIDPDDIDGLTDHLLNLAGNLALRSVMSESARSVCEAHFSWSNELTKLLGFYEQEVNGSK